MLTHETVLNRTYSERDKRLLTVVARDMKTGITKQEVIDKYKLPERNARDILNAVGFKYPTGSYAGADGKHVFKLIISKEDLNINEYKILDRISRMSELGHSILPNIKVAQALGVEYVGLYEELARFLRHADAKRVIQYTTTTGDKK